MAQPTAPADVARSYLSAFASADPEAIAAHVSDDFYNEHTSALGDSCEGKSAYLERLPGFLRAFEGLTYEVEDVVAEGERVFASYTMTAVSAGHPISIRCVVRLVITDGLIVQRNEYFDSLTYLRQVGQAE